MKSKMFYYLFGALSFIIPSVIYLSNASDALGFADAGEFALVTKILSIAHPPGFPSYVFTGWIWGKIAALFSSSHVWNMIYFSVFCSAAGCVLLYLSVVKILEKNENFEEWLKHVVGLFTAIGFATGVTTWYWSHGVEVYAFQILAFALLLYGLVGYNIDRKRYQLIIAAVGMGLGLTNHHLTMVLFLPFGLVFMSNDVLIPVTSFTTSGKKYKKSFHQNSFWSNLFQNKDVYWAIGVTIGIILFFYGAMMIRASAEMPFKFGSPDNFSRLVYHMSGGAWIKNTQQEVEGIIGMRFPYFMQLTYEQMLSVIPFIIGGIIFLFQMNLRLLLFPTIVYYLVLLFYQLRIDQTADTDAYMIFPFYALYLLVPYGVIWLNRFQKHLWLTMPVLAAVAIFINYPKANSKDYDVSTSIMHTLDYSTPKNSVVIIADWTTVANYYYYRIAENFRPDLIVLNYDLKFTHKDILPTMYPEFYAFIKKEYDRFIQLLIKYHPEQAYNTGCTLDNIELSNAFRDLTFKMQEYAKIKDVAYMTDPKTFVFALRDKLMTTQSHVSGMFVSKTNTGLGKEFLKLDYAWLKSERIMRDPAASDKVVDLEAMLDFHRNFYKNSNDNENYEKAQKSYLRIKQLQKDMKAEMPFLFRPGGK
jgi:hypothetical protein